MQWLTRTDMILWAIAAYVAITALVRLMQRRRDDLVADVERQVAAHRKKAKRAANPDQAPREAA